MTEKVELRPCPICGGEAELLTRGNDVTKKRSAEIKCKECGCLLVVGAIRFPLTWAVKKVSDKWNTRTADPASIPRSDVVGFCEKIINELECGTSIKPKTRVEILTSIIDFAGGEK